MKKSTVTVIILVVIALAGITAYALSQKADDNSDDNNTNTSQTGQDGTDADDEVAVDNPAEEAATATITYTNGGFTPGSVSVLAGQTIRVVNNSSDTLQFESDPHPVHTDNPELNISSISPGSSKTFSVSEKGTWGFHNHQNDSHTGTLIVE